MRKYFSLAIFTALLLIFNSTLLHASIVNELNFVNEKTDFYSYINFSQIMNFISTRGINIDELDAMTLDDSTNETGRVIKGFGIKLSDVNEFLMVMNTQDIEKKSGYLVFMSIKNGKGIIPEEFKKNSVKLKTATAYKASADEDILFTKIDDFYIIGPQVYLESFLENRSSKKISLSARSSAFLKRASAKSIFFHLTVSDYLKNAMNTAMKNDSGVTRGLRENVFIQTLLSLESMDWGMEMNDKIVFQSGLQGTKIEDSERLQMLSHTWIVGSSFVISFADLMAARSGAQSLNELTSDQKLMSWMQKAVGRIHVKQEDKGVVISFEMTSEESDLMISFLKKEMEKEKIARAERIEREKISKLTAAIAENNTEKVQLYIKEKYNLNGFDTDGNTPLGAAAMNGNVKIAKMLIEKGAGINTPNNDKLSPLHLAVKSEKTEVIVFLLGKGCDVNAKGDTDLTALHYNSMQGNSEITRLLLAKGALINAVDADASTPLHYAASSGFIKIVKVLVEKKADAALLNSASQRAIDIAAQNNQTEVVDFLKLKFKQEPKSYSYEENYSNEDLNTNDENEPLDENAVIEEENID